MVFPLAVPARADNAVALENKAKAVHKRIIVLDSHLDIPLDYGTGDHDPAVDGTTQVDLPKLRRGGVAASVFAVAVNTGPRTAEAIAAASADAHVKLAAIQGIAARHPDQASLALTPDDVVRIHKQGKFAVVIGLLNAYPLGKNIDEIDAYYKAGVRTFGFVHAGNNDFADSSRPFGIPPEEHGGLSPLGKLAVTKLNRLGVIIDVSQMTKAGLLQTIQLSKAPVIASHSGIRALVESERNLSDEELDAVKANNGVVQIVAFLSYVVPPGPDYDARLKALRVKYNLPETYKTTWSDTEKLPVEQRNAYLMACKNLLRPATVSDVVDSIDYAVKRIGIDHVGVSSDFNHGGGVEGWNNAGEALGVTRELVRRGYSEAQIAKIWGGNFLRVWHAVETTATKLQKQP